MSEECREYADIIHLVWPDWEVVEKIGSGAFATVVRASRRNRIEGEKDSAIKIIRIPNDDSEWNQMLAEGKSAEQAEKYYQNVVDDSLKEIRAMEDLTGNTNIVSIFDYKVHKVQDRHIWYILIRMEYLEKVDTSVLSEKEIIRMGMDVCTALSICRKKNIVHRDVSLDNVFIHDGNYKLGDFGVAKVLEGTIGTMHSIAGKPLYMAPEVYNATLADTDIDSAAKVDIYSLGILLYRLSNNMKYPFEDPDQENTSAKERNLAFRRRVIDGEALPPPKNASPEFTEVILKASMANPGKRYESAEDMKKALAALIKGELPPPPPPRNKALLIIACVTAILAVCYLFLKPMLFPGWSEWSSWTETRQEITDPNQMQEETKGAIRWKAKRCPSCGWHYPVSYNTCPNPKCRNPVAEGQVVYAYSDDSASEPILGELGRKIDGSSFWFDGEVTLYRYRDKSREGKPEADQYCYKWYFSTYENSEDYPGITFTANGADEYIAVYADADRKNLIITDNQTGEMVTREAVVEDGVLKADYLNYTLEDGKLTERFGSSTWFYTREPQAQQIPYDISSIYEEKLKPEDYNGIWVVTKYGQMGAFVDAETMGLSGKAVIEDGRMTLTWTRDGVEKSEETVFDKELNRGRLYTVVNELTSIIVSMREEHTILLQGGLSQTQWVLRKENMIDEETVRLEAPDFEEAFAQRTDWTETDETRNELANLLFNTAVANGLDTANIKADGSFYLALIMGGNDSPVLICEGTGDYADGILTIGRGIPYQTQKPDIYYGWADHFTDKMLHPEQSVIEYEIEEVWKANVAGNRIWPVQINPE